LEAATMSGIELPGVITISDSCVSLGCPMP
jgi:hypothetical protein